jgi:hypothetical protein
MKPHCIAGVSAVAFVLWSNLLAGFVYVAGGLLLLAGIALPCRWLW